MKHFISLLTLVLAGMTILISSAEAQLPNHRTGGVMITTTVKNGVVTAWNIGCPGNGKANAFVVDIMKESKGWTDSQISEFDRLVNQFEQANGIQIRSGSIVRNFRLTNDTIQTTSTGPMTGPGAGLCEWLRANCPSLQQ